MKIPTKEYLAKYILSDKNYFEIADKYVEYSEIFITETLFKTIELWVEMIIQPLCTLLYALYTQQMPSVFVVLGLKKTYELWQKYFEFQYYNSQIADWMQIVRSVGGPFISTNDPKYHIFVYAHTMQQLHSFFPKN